MTGFFQDLLNMYKNRLKNVLYSTFVISWVIVNWEFVFILFFSNDIPQNTVKFLNENYTFLKKWMYFLVIPILLTIAHIFVISRLSEWIYGHWLNHIKKLSDKKKEIEGNMLLTVNEGQEIRVENAHLKLELESLKKKHVEELSAIQKKNSVKQKTPSKPNISDILQEITSSQWNILNDEHLNNIVKIHKEGGKRYDINRKIDVRERDKISNLNNIFKHQGISFYEKRLSYDPYLLLSYIEWDREKFSP